MLYIPNILDIWVIQKVLQNCGSQHVCTGIYINVYMVHKVYLKLQWHVDAVHINKDHKIKRTGHNGPMVRKILWPKEKQICTFEVWNMIIMYTIKKWCIICLLKETVTKRWYSCRIMLDSQSYLATSTQFMFRCSLIDGFTNFMHTILTKVVLDNLKASPRFVWHSNN